MLYVKVPNDRPEPELEQAEKNNLIKDILFYLNLCTSRKSLYAIKDYLKYWINPHDKTMRKPTKEELKEYAARHNADLETLERIFN